MVAANGSHWRITAEWLSAYFLQAVGRRKQNKTNKKLPKPTSDKHFVSQLLIYIPPLQLEFKLLYLLASGQCLCCYELLVRSLQVKRPGPSNFYKILDFFFFFPSGLSLSLLPRLVGEMSLLKSGHWLSDHNHTQPMKPSLAPSDPPPSPPLCI